MSIIRKSSAIYSSKEPMGLRERLESKSYLDRVREKGTEKRWERRAQAKQDLSNKSEGAKPSSLFGERKEWRQKDLDWRLFKKGSPYVRGATTGLLFPKGKRRGMIIKGFPERAYRTSVDERELNTKLDILRKIEKGYGNRLTSREKYYATKEDLGLSRKEAKRLRLYYQQNILRK